MLKEMYHVFTKTVLWGVVGLFMHMVKAFDIKEHISTTNRPQYIMIILMCVLTCATALGNIWLQDVNHKTRFNKIINFVYDQLHDGAISIFGLVSLTVVFGLAITQQPIPFFIFSLILLAWSLVCGYGKYIYKIISDDDLDILNYFKSSKIKFLHTRNGATLFISLITISVSAYLIYACINQI